MRKLIIALVVASVGFNLHPVKLDKVPTNKDPKHPGQYPAIYLPPELRQRNWLGPKREGSCVHATMTMCFRIQRRFKMAEWWRANNGDGEWPADLAAKFDKAGVKYAYTAGKGDVKFLKWAVDTQRGCGVTVRGASHMVLLIHLDKKWAGLIDNNSPNQIQWVPREAFIAEWLNSESWAITPCYKPSPPLPVRVQ